MRDTQATQALRMLREAGYDPEVVDGGRHPKVRWVDQAGQMRWLVVSKTQGRGRAMANAAALLRRKMRECSDVRLASLLLAVLLAACQTAAPTVRPALTNDQAFKLARERLVAGLKDPDSARIDPKLYRRTSSWLSGSADVVCGRVNAKNSFGGYTGMVSFVYFVERDEVQVDSSDMPMASVACSG